MAVHFWGQKEKRLLAEPESTALLRSRRLLPLQCPLNDAECCRGPQKDAAPRGCHQCDALETMSCPTLAVMGGGWEAAGFMVR